MSKTLWLIDINSNIGLSEKSLQEILKTQSNSNINNFSKHNKLIDQYYQTQYTEIKSLWAMETNSYFYQTHLQNFPHEINYNYSITEDNLGDIFINPIPLLVSYRKLDELVAKFVKPQDEIILVVRITKGWKSNLNLTNLINQTIAKYSPKYWLFYGDNSFTLFNQRVSVNALKSPLNDNIGNNQLKPDDNVIDNLPKPDDKMTNNPLKNNQQEDFQVLGEDKELKEIIGRFKHKKPKFRGSKINNPIHSLELDSTLFKTYQMQQINLKSQNFGSIQQKNFYFWFGVNKKTIILGLNELLKSNGKGISEKLTDKEVNKIKYNLKKVLVNFEKNIKNLGYLRHKRGDKVKILGLSKSINNWDVKKSNFLISLNKIWFKIAHLEEINLKLLDFYYLKLMVGDNLSFNDKKFLKIYRENRQLFDSWWKEEQIWKYPETFRLIKNRTTHFIDQNKLEVISKMQLTDFFIKFSKNVEISHRLKWFVDLKYAPMLYNVVTNSWKQVNFNDLIDIKELGDWNIKPLEIGETNRLKMKNFQELLELPPISLLKESLKALIIEKSIKKVRK